MDTPRFRQPIGPVCRVGESPLWNAQTASLYGPTCAVLRCTGTTG